MKITNTTYITIKIEPQPERGAMENIVTVQIGEMLKTYGTSTLNLAMNLLSAWPILGGRDFALEITEKLFGETQ